MNKTKNIILSFLRKFFFILKAASDGWIIKYIGANQFEFRYIKFSSNPSVKEFLKHYIYKPLL